MGWKALKEHYQIEHLVTVQQEYICIGSNLCRNLAMIDTETGKIVPNSTFADFLPDNYPTLASASDAERLALIEQADQFKASIPVFTFGDGKIIEKQCEATGHPNVTHDGILMYHNRFTTDRNQAVSWAMNDLESWKATLTECIERLEREIDEKQEELEVTIRQLSYLQREYPDATANRSAEETA